MYVNILNAEKKFERGKINLKSREKKGGETKECNKAQIVTDPDIATRHITF